ncbi:hypothetical protein FA13DRAFT_1089475 [Coprinellus micaceus]|uniref:Uncharacterized protein n=1 Tax=Coprinellus micaceus TaxID=71717 RepID=A0A4Y7TSK7_COPMI|nr:hypothetical protein FA13DRAFT_1089475 [Coprinellus micaceus]
MRLGVHNPRGHFVRPVSSLGGQNESLRIALSTVIEATSNQAVTPLLGRSWCEDQRWTAGLKVDSVSFSPCATILCKETPGNFQIAQFPSPKCLPQRSTGHTANIH